MYESWTYVEAKLAQEPRLPWLRMGGKNRSRLLSTLTGRSPAMTEASASV
jgi:hypothetical protein